MYVSHNLQLRLSCHNCIIEWHAPARPALTLAFLAPLSSGCGLCICQVKATLFLYFTYSIVFAGFTKVYNKFFSNFCPESRFLKQDKVEAETALTLKTSMSITIYEMTMMTFRRWHSWLHRSTITTIMQWPAPGHQDNLLGDRYSLPAIQASIQCTQSVFNHTSDNMSNSIYCMSTDWLLMLGWY